MATYQEMDHRMYVGPTGDVERQEAAKAAESDMVRMNRMVAEASYEEPIQDRRDWVVTMSVLRDVAGYGTWLGFDVESGCAVKPEIRPDGSPVDSSPVDL